MSAEKSAAQQIDARTTLRNLNNNLKLYRDVVEMFSTNIAVVQLICPPVVNRKE